MHGPVHHDTGNWDHSVVMTESHAPGHSLAMRGASQLPECQEAAARF